MAATGVIFVAALGLGGCTAGDINLSDVPGGLIGQSQQGVENGQSASSAENESGQTPGGAPGGSAEPAGSGGAGQGAARNVAVVGQMFVDEPGSYRWDGAGLRVADGAPVEINTSSELPAQIIGEGAVLDLRFGTGLGTGTVVTFDGSSLEDLRITLPEEYSFTVTHDALDATLIYDGCWHGKCYNASSTHIQGIGVETGPTGLVGDMMFLFTAGSAKTIRISNG
ncbi:MAG: hypothetical protein LBJ02_05200 [Bifidobacteriaceae bacterium]|nr:hypothetical protein [Bifidobacteriaceae bacterium]